MRAYNSWMAVVGVAMTVVCIVGLSGCESQVGPTAPTAPAGQMSAADGSIGLDVGNMAPEIEGQDVDGNSFRLSDYRGSAVVISFWGDW